MPLSKKGQKIMKKMKKTYGKKKAQRVFYASRSKGGKRVGKQFGGALAAGVRPLARGLGYKHGSKKPAKKA